MSKPGAEPPAGSPQQWDELTLESTRTLKARVLVPAKPKAVAVPAVPHAGKPNAGIPDAEKPAAKSSASNDLFSLENTLTAKARVLPADQARKEAEAKASAVSVQPAEPPRRARLSTNELHALSIKIKAEREKAELLKFRGATSPPATKKPSV